MAQDHNALFSDGTSAPAYRHPANPPSVCAGRSTSTIRRPGLALAHLFLASTVLSFAMGLVPALTTSFRAIHNLSGQQIANLHNLKDIGLMVAVLGGPRLVSRVGVTMTLHTAIGIALAGCAVFLGANSFVGLMVGAFLHGAAFSIAGLAIVTYLFRLPVEYQRISALFSTFGIASFIAPAGVTVLTRATGGYGAVYAAYALLLVLLALTGLLVASQQGPQADRHLGVASAPQLSLAQLRRWLPELMTYSAIMAAETVVVSWITSLAQYRYGASLAAASLLLGTLWAVHTPVRAAGDHLVRALSHQRVISIGIPVAAAGTTIACLGSMPLAYVGIVVFACGIAPLVPVYQGWVLSRIPIDLQPPMSASLSLGATIATTLTIWITGLAMDVDVRLPFVAAVLLMVWVGFRVVRLEPTATPSPEAPQVQKA